MNFSLLRYLTRNKLQVACFCTVLAIGLVSYLVFYRERLRLAEAGVAQAQERLARIGELQNHIAAAENAASGYVITGDPEKLASFEAPDREIDKFFTPKGRLIAETPEKREQLRELQALVQERRKISQRLIEARRSQRSATELMVVMAQGQEIDDRLYTALGDLQRDEKKIALTQGAQTKKQIKQWTWVFTGGVLWILSMVLLVLYLFYHEISERRGAEAKLVDYQERLRSLASQITLAKERERRRIAVLLHDQIGQKLAVTYIKLGQVSGLSPQALEAAVGEIRQVVKHAIQDAKSLTFQISSPILYELGLEAAVEWLTEELQSQHGTVAYFDDDLQPKPLEEDLRVLLYQAVSELLLNVVKHARARHVQVSIWREGETLRLGVYDDGVGFDTAAIRKRWGRREGGFGLFSIRERLRSYGGGLEVESRPGFGTQVVMTVPLQAEPGE